MAADTDISVHGKELSGKTLKELQALAKARGLKRYSKLTKEQLLKRLASAAAPPTPAVSAPESDHSPRAAAHAQDSAAASATTPAAMETKPAPLPVSADIETPAAAAESSVQRVERAKYELRPNGATASESGADLGEDIDRLPALNEPIVCLLPQKPGVLYAYWVLPAAETAGIDYKLRLCRGPSDAIEVCEEIGAQAPHGSWYFHVAENAGNLGMQAQLGHYRDGRFVLARGRSIAHLPSLYASTRTDERWWISEADFMRMYFRAGGFVTATHRFGWLASIGSPGAPPPGPEEHLAWPGAVSSRAR